MAITRNIRQSSSGQYYLTFVSRDTGEIVNGRFLPWSRMLLMVLGSHREQIKIRDKTFEVVVPHFQFAQLEEYSLLIGSDLVNCEELWQ